MALYARHLGWLHSRPDKKTSRAENLNEEDPLLKLPEADEYMVRAWHQCGLCSTGGAGFAVLNWSEIDAYSRVTKSNLTPWEAETLRLMSSCYISEYQKASDDANRPAPYCSDEVNLEALRSNVAQAFKAMFKQQAAKQ